MVEQSFVVRLPEGLHARPAAEIAAICSHLSSASIGRLGEEPVDAKSILGILTLGIRNGETLTFRLDGEGAESALRRLELLVTAL